jgi:hypothetical protein
MTAKTRTVSLDPGGPRSSEASSVQELIIGFQLPCLEPVCAVGSSVGLSVVTRVERLASFQELTVLGRLSAVSSFKDLLSRFAYQPRS